MIFLSIHALASHHPRVWKGRFLRVGCCVPLDDSLACCFGSYSWHASTMSIDIVDMSLANDKNVFKVGDKFKIDGTSDILTITTILNENAARNGIHGVVANVSIDDENIYKHNDMLDPVFLYGRNNDYNYMDDDNIRFRLTKQSGGRRRRSSKRRRHRRATKKTTRC